MTFNHANHVSSVPEEIYRAAAKMCCMIGCILIAAFGHNATTFYSLLPGEATQEGELSQSTNARTANLNGNSNLLSTEVFFVSDDKTNPFLLLLADRGLSVCATTGLYPFYITYAHLSDRFSQRTPNIYYTTLPCSTPLRC